jgi:hypothetical protein
MRTEKRHSQRKLVALDSFILCDELGVFQAPKPVQTLNLSSTGALIESSDRLVVKDVCTFKLVTDDGRSADIQGRIVWVEQGPGGAYRAGVAFRNLTPDEQYLLDLQLARGAQSRT